MNNIKKTIVFLCFCFVVSADDLKLINATFIEGYMDESATMEDQYKLLNSYPPRRFNVLPSYNLLDSRMDETQHFEALYKYL